MTKVTTSGGMQFKPSHPILVVDSYARGISIGRIDPAGSGLELEMDGERSTPMSLRSRYVMKQGEPLIDLERHLQRLSAQGDLRRTTVVFGVTTDPFHPFDEKFATSMKFLGLFERYVPGRLIIQTRSPLVVIGLPMLKKVRDTTYVSVGIETPLEEVARRKHTGLKTLGFFGQPHGVVYRLAHRHRWQAGKPGIRATLQTERGLVQLSSPPHREAPPTTLRD